MLKQSVPPQTTQLLRGVPMFATTSDKELKLIASVARSVSFEPGTVICDEGKSGIGLHVLVEGEVEVTSSHAPPSRLGPGAYFGEIALLDGGPRLATVRATTHVSTLSIVAWDFKAILDEQPAVARGLLLEMCRRLREQAAAYTH